MTDEQREIEELLRAKLLRLNAAVSGLVTGLMAGIILFLATLWLVLKGGEVVGPHLALLGQFFPGYQVTLMGSFVGFFYAFLIGAIAGFLVATLYNWLIRLRAKNGATVPPAPQRALGGQGAGTSRQRSSE